MKLRIARKMDMRVWPPRKKRDRGSKRLWWTVYTDEQLRRAEQRLRTSWRRRCPVQADGGRGVSQDFFAANRVQSRRTRQRALRRHRSGDAARIAARLARGMR